MPEEGSRKKVGDEPEEIPEEMTEELAEEAADRGPVSEKGMEEKDLGYDEQANMPTEVMPEVLAEEAADRGPDPEAPMAAGDLGYPATPEEPAPQPEPVAARGMFGGSLFPCIQIAGIKKFFGHDAPLADSIS